MPASRQAPRRRAVWYAERMRVWATLGAAALSGLVLLASCREPTEVTLELTTDLPCAALGDTSIYVGTAQELAGPLSGLTAAAVTHGCIDAQAGRIGSIVVLPSRGDDERFSLRVVTGRSGATCTADLRSGCIEVRRSLGFVPHTPLRLPLELSKTCENVVCDNASDTCLAGKCVPSAVDCSNGCSSPPTDAGLVDATPLLDVISSDVLSNDALVDAPNPFESGLPDASTNCAPPAPDAGVPTFTWHFDEGAGTLTSEANKLLPDAVLPSGATFVPGAGSGCKTAISPGGTTISLGTSALLASASFSVDLWFKTTKATVPLLTLQEYNSQAPAWTLTLMNGAVTATLCATGCVSVQIAAGVNDGAWHRAGLTRKSGGTVALFVDGTVASLSNPPFKAAANGQLLVLFSGAVDELRFSILP